MHRKYVILNKKALIIKNEVLLTMEKITKSRKITEAEIYYTFLIHTFFRNTFVSSLHSLDILFSVIIFLKAV